MMAVCLLSTCVDAQNNSLEIKQSLKSNKILIVYLSRSGNTKAITEIIQQYGGGELIGLELVHPYSTNYKETVEQVSKENETNYLPPLKTTIDSFEKYNVVFVGFPTWGMQLPPPMKSFFKQYNLGGKMVIPFNTNAGYGVGSSFNTVNELCKDSKILEGFSIEGGVERDGVLFTMEGDKMVKATSEIKMWLQKLTML
jgi:flavodoxin